MTCIAGSWLRFQKRVQPDAQKINPLSVQLNLFESDSPMLAEKSNKYHLK